MQPENARKAISDNCQEVLQHAHYRKTYKGVAEVGLSKTEDNENEENQDEEMN